MKITKRQLRRIIRESILYEAMPGDLARRAMWSRRPSLSYEAGWEDGYSGFDPDKGQAPDNAYMAGYADGDNDRNKWLEAGAEGIPDEYPQNPGASK